MTPGQQLALAAVAALAAAGKLKKRSGSASFRLPQTQKRRLVELLNAPGEYGGGDPESISYALELARQLGGIDFSNVRLREGLDLSEIDLSGANMAGVTLKQAYLVATNLNNTDFGGANLTGSRINSNMLPEIEIKGANFSRAIIRYAEWNSNFVDCDFSGAVFRGSDVDAKFNYCALDGADFARMGDSSSLIFNVAPAWYRDEVKGARFGMRNVVFRGSQIIDLSINSGSRAEDRAVFRCDFSKMSMKNTSFSHVHFIECDFTGFQSDSLYAYDCRFDRCLFDGSLVRDGGEGGSNSGMGFGVKR